MGARSHKRLEIVQAPHGGDDDARVAHLWFLESMDRVNRAMQGGRDLEVMAGAVLDAMLEIFACDRAWLAYPCDPHAPSWHPVVERTQPDFPGAAALQAELPMDADVAVVLSAARARSGVLRLGPQGDLEVPSGLAARFSIRSQMAMAIDPKVDRPYLLGLHECTAPRAWTAAEQRLLQEIGRRLTDALATLLVMRSLRESERKLEAAQRIARVGWWERDFRTQRVTLSDEVCRTFGVEPVDLPQWQERWLGLIHPDDRATAAAAAAAAVRGGPRYDVEYRVVRPDGAIRVVHSQGDVIWDETGLPLRQFGVLQDITELRRAERELRASESRFRKFVDHATDAFFV
ncbi:MAG TPA: PAS domain-containing protein, partial [Caldimonas sp.]|nr:PAS domain-containing protein [Caldimonas sp.]